MDKHDKFKTTDIILAAVLKIEGYEMIDIERNAGKGTFVFMDVDKDVINEFDLGRVKVEPITFNNSIKQLTTSVRRMY